MKYYVLLLMAAMVIAIVLASAHVEWWQTAIIGATVGAVIGFSARWGEADGYREGYATARREEAVRSLIRK